MSADSNSRAGRLGRLILKEQKEILRDRRTLLTLVIMPLALYPIVGLVIQQFMVATAHPKAPIYQIGFHSERDYGIVDHLLQLSHGGKPPTAEAKKSLPTIQGVVQAPEELKRLLETGDIDVVVVVRNPLQIDPSKSIEVNLDFAFVQGRKLSEEAAKFLRGTLDTVSKLVLAQRLAELRVPQRPEPIRIEARTIPNPDRGAGFPLASVAPLMLILMTITGAVYPAIDLTAGERERGTLEMLMAAPIPRLSILVAKYSAVLTVALLTALVNVVAMTATLYLTDVGRMIVGDAGLGWMTILQGLAALVLFVGFFAALLLALASFARSFKEAQAYLIPLMLVALAPGVISLFPGVELTPATAAAPLLNIVLFSRDLLRGGVDGWLTGIVLVSNACYAIAALGLAARLFGSEGVLYGGSGSWSGLVRRPSSPQLALPLSTAVLLAVMSVPAFLLLSGVGKLAFPNNVIAQTLAGAVVLIVIFAVIPIATAWGRNVPVARAFALRSSSVAILFAALLLGASLWPFALSLRQQSWASELLADNPELVKRLTVFVEELKRMPLPAGIILFALIPAVCEELFFRGLLFGAVARFGPMYSILATAFFFAAFHVISPSGLTPDRFTPSLMLGLVLGFVRWRSQSIFPGMLLHLLHNGIVIAAINYPHRLGVAATEGGGLTIPNIVYSGAGLAVAVAFVLMVLAPKPVSREPEASAPRE